MGSWGEFPFHLEISIHPAGSAIIPEYAQIIHLTSIHWVYMKMLQVPLTTINILVNKELKAFVMDEITEFSFMGYGKMKEGSY